MRIICAAVLRLVFNNVQEFVFYKDFSVFIQRFHARERQPIITISGYSSHLGQRAITKITISGIEQQTKKLNFRHAARSITDFAAYLVP